MNRREFFDWLKKHGLPYEPAGADDFVQDAELLIVDLLRDLDPKTSLYVQADIIRINEVRETGMVYYRYHPTGEGECWVMKKILLIHETSVVVRSLLLADVIQMKTASR